MKDTKASQQTQADLARWNWASQWSITLELNKQTPHCYNELEQHGQTHQGTQQLTTCAVVCLTYLTSKKIFFLIEKSKQNV